MKLFLFKVKQAVNLVAGFFPTRLPTGATEFAKWSDSIISTYGPLIGLPDNDSVRWALAVQIMHLGPSTARKPKRYFAMTLHKAAASQVAAYIVQELKNKQQAEATAPASVPVNAVK